jgi:glycosyltransferase involved in cell wall biosynthesis
MNHRGLYSADFRDARSPITKGSRMSTDRIVYLVLGERRAQAARRLATGARLVSSAADLRGAGAPAPDATLVAGNAAAIPVVWEIARRRPDLTLATAPDTEPGRRPAEADLAVITPWYPGPDDDLAGAFVKATTTAVRSGFERVLTVHSEGWFYPSADYDVDEIEAATGRLAAAGATVSVTDAPLGELARLAVPCPTPGDYATWIDAHVRALRAVLPTGRIEAPVVHAHTGIYGGAQAAALARPDARIVVTEHTSFLPRIFKQPGVRRRYAAVVRRADVVLCVGSVLRDYLAEQFPKHAGKFHVVPNPVDFDAFAVRPQPVTALHRWLYLGRLVKEKGVLTLLEAFAQVAADDPEPTLTLVGAGPLADDVRRRVAEAGLAERVRLLDPVPPDQVNGLLHEHDLLVHLSHKETFGMTVLEAVASGTPVLVTACEGPSETLAGLEKQVGSVIEITEDPAVVVAAYRELAGRLSDLNLPAARAELRDRYGNEAVAAKLNRWYHEPVDHPGETSPAPGPGLPGRIYAALLARAARRPSLRYEIALRRLAQRKRGTKPGKGQKA